MIGPSEIADAVLRLPARFKTEWNVPFIPLLRESGYCDDPNAVTEIVIRKALARSPGYLEDWKIFSEDKRTDGWYWERDSSGKYRVVHAKGPNWTITEVRLYSDQISACAGFIKREIETYRILGERLGL